MMEWLKVETWAGFVLLLIGLAVLAQGQSIRREGVRALTEATEMLRTACRMHEKARRP